MGWERQLAELLVAHGADLIEVALRDGVRVRDGAGTTHNATERDAEPPPGDAPRQEERKNECHVQPAVRTTSDLRTKRS
jgi:hypothetical protein